MSDLATKHDNLEEMFEYLDELRESGSTNMMGAGVDLREEFGLDKYEARKVLGEWMRTFGKRNPV